MESMNANSNPFFRPEDQPAKTSRGVGRPKGSKNKTKKQVTTTKNRNVTLAAETAKRFTDMRDSFNKESSLPFDLNNSQFMALMVEFFEQNFNNHPDLFKR